MRISLTRNENVPGHFFCLGTFFDFHTSRGSLSVKPDTNRALFYACFSASIAVSRLRLISKYSCDNSMPT